MEVPRNSKHDESPIPVFVNERAGGGNKGALQALVAALDRARVAVELRPVDPPCLATEVARAADQGAPVVGVGGGDGSIRTAAEVLAGRMTILAPFPLGTLNHFARRMNLGEVGDAARAMVAGSVVEVPVGVVDDHLFLNTATFGLYADVVRRRNQIRGWLPKWPAAVVASAVTLLRMRRVQVVLDVEGMRLHRATPLVWVGVGRSSFPFAHEAPVEQDEPVLEVVVVRSGGGLAIVALLARLLLRLARREHPGSDPALEVFHARAILLRAPSPVGATVDGELFRWNPPLFIAIQKDALRVMTAGVSLPRTRPR